LRAIRDDGHAPAEHVREIEDLHFLRLLERQKQLGFEILPDGEFRGESTIRHASIHTPLEWCRKELVGRAIFSHCGSSIVNDDPEAVAAKVRLLGSDAGVDATIAHDGLIVAL
jgi:hypothetical protein